MIQKQIEIAPVGFSVVWISKQCKATGLVLPYDKAFLIRMQLYTHNWS